MVLGGEVVDFMYKDSSGPWSGALTKSGVVKFLALDKHVVPFLPGFTNTVSISIIQAEYIYNRKNLICRPFPLMIYWVYTIHKYQGNILDPEIIYLG